MSRLLRFPAAVRRDPAIARWLQRQPGELGAIAKRWFETMRECGDDVRELLHDGHPTACVGDAAFGYVNMRHVKLRPGCDVDATALVKLIQTAYADMKRRLVKP